VLMLLVPGPDPVLKWLATWSGVRYSTLKHAAERDSLTHPQAVKIAGLFEDDREATVDWLMHHTGSAPQRPKMALRSPLAARSALGGTEIAPRSPMHRQRAARVAAAVEQTILRNELYGEEVDGRQFLIRNLTLFADDLADHECDNRDIVAVLAALVKGEL
jgi:hypothetical protein